MSEKSKNIEKKREMIPEEVQKRRALRLKELLEIKGLTRAEASRRSADFNSENGLEGYIKESELSDWIKGKRPLTEYKALQIIEEIAPEILPDWLLGYSEFRSQDELQDHLRKTIDERDRSALILIDNAVKEVTWSQALRDGVPVEDLKTVELPQLNNIPEILFLQAQIKEYANQIVWSYLQNRDHSPLWGDILDQDLKQ